MSFSLPHILSGISIMLLVIYGADVIAGGTTAGNGFLPFNAMTRGVVFGFPPVILSIIAFFMSKKPPYKGLGIMLVITGALIIIGGAISISSALKSENSARMIGEGGSLIVVGVIIAVLGAIKIKKSQASVSWMPTCAKCNNHAVKVYDCDHTNDQEYCTECYTELHYYLTEEK